MGVHWSAEAYIAAKSFSGSFKRARAPRVGIKQKVPVCFAAYGIVFVFNFDIDLTQRDKLTRVKPLWHSCARSKEPKMGFSAM